MTSQRLIPSASQIGRLALVVGLLGCGLFAGSARAEDATYAQRLACTPDAWRLCSDQIPDVDAVKACMIAKKAQLSAACRATFPKEVASR